MGVRVTVGHNGQILYNENRLEDTAWQDSVHPPDSDSSATSVRDSSVVEGYQYSTLLSHLISRDHVLNSGRLSKCETFSENPKLTVNLEIGVRSY